ncbi:MAG: pglF 1 [Bacillota bacterium]|nr:pglF 1 [Bacillota bacterium]
MRRKLVSLVMIITDILIISLVPFLVLFLRFEGVVSEVYYTQLFHYFPAVVLIRLGSLYIFRLYHRLWRYASIHELMGIIGAVTVGSVLIYGYSMIVGFMPPRSIYVLSWIFNIMLIGSSRLGIRMLHYILRLTPVKPIQRVLIIGAGDAGAMIAREIIRRYYETKKLIGFIDDSSYKKSQMIFGVKVLGTQNDISRVVQDYDINEIIIAMPSVSGDIVREIVKMCQKTKCSVQTVPGIYELIDGKFSLQQLRKVNLEDLLRRDPVKLNLDEIADYLTGKRVLVTGAGGSIGSELCRQVAKMSPETLVILGKGENSIYEIDQELKNRQPLLALTPVIADVRDQKRMDEVFSQFQPQVVFHAAAHKHVPLMESQPAEAVRNNVFGTKTVAEAAHHAGAEVFVMVSTDKAVNPTSVMGATKRVAELIIQNISKKSATKFVVVRFGNVLGSRGSVIPLFKKQIAQGGPITITHPDMERYFMTIPEASQLILQAGAIAKGGEVFVLDMGKPVKIFDMACDLIELSGLLPHKDIQIQFTGIRPGEKLFEELMTAKEGTASTKHEKIFVANLKTVDEKKLRQRLLALQQTVGNVEVIQELAKLVPTFQSAQLKKRKVAHESDVIPERGASPVKQYQTVNDVS